MKAVIKSCKPYWTYLIIKKIKIIEIGKTKPISKDWDKTVYIYCSKDKKPFNQILKEDKEWFNQFVGKIIGKFYCGGMMCKEALFMSHAIRQHCVPKTQLADYSNGNALFGWRITDLKLYNKPKKLNKFNKSCI